MFCKFVLLLTEKIKKIMEKQKTAVEWLVSELFKDLAHWQLNLVRKALEMEKQQIIDANETYSQNGNDYYSQKYGKHDANI